MKKFALTVAAMLASASAVPAYSQAFTGGAGTFTNLGDDGRNSGFDVVDFAPLAGVYSGNGTYNLNGVTFTVGINRDTAFTTSGTLGGLVGSFGGNPFTYSVDYALTIDAADTITLGGNTIDVFGTPVFLNPLTLTSGIGSTAGVLQATVGPVSGAVPEPATWAMMMLGFGMAGFGLRSRGKSKVTTRVAFA